MYDFPAMFFVYFFMYEPSVEVRLRHPYEPSYSKGEKAFYAYSEEDARKQYKKFYGIDAGELIRRENW